MFGELPVMVAPAVAEATEALVDGPVKVVLGDLLQRHR